MKSFRLFIACTLLCLLAATATAQSRRSPIEVDRVVAVVNDEAITLFELRTRLAHFEAHRILGRVLRGRRRLKMMLGVFRSRTSAFHAGVFR